MNVTFYDDKENVDDKVKQMIEARARINADSGVSVHKMTETKPKSKPKNTLLRPFKCPKLRCPPRKIAIPKLEPGDVSIFMKD